MTKLTKHRPREALDADAFVEAVQAVLDYLWEDEQRHHSEQDSADQPHIFHSLQVIREWLSDLRAEARQVEATEPSTPAAQTASTVKNEDGVGASRKITLHEGDCGTYTIEAEDGRTMLIQTDWDYPGVASIFGWRPCPCGETDGTVDCPHRTASEMIAEAGEFLNDHIGDTAEDPGYFEE